MISEANDAIAKVSKTGVLLEETSAMMENVENCLLLSVLGIFTPLLVVKTFFLKGTFIEIEKKMKNLLLFEAQTCHTLDTKNTDTQSNMR